MDEELTQTVPEISAQLKLFQPIPHGPNKRKAKKFYTQII